MFATLAQGLFDLSRARQALLSVAQPALGAILAVGAMPSARVLVFGLVAATAGYLAVFSLNDVLDLDSDVDALRAGKGDFEGFDLDTGFTRHPLAAGVIGHGIALWWVISLAVVAIAFAWALNPLCVLVFGASVTLEALYCALRKVTWAKAIVSGIMVGLGGLAGWVAVAPLDTSAAVFFAFLAFWEIAGRNLPNDLSDVAADSAVGLATVATKFGPRASSQAILAGSAVTLATLPLLPLGPVQAAGSLAGGIVLMALPALELLRMPTPEQAARYFNRASLLPAIVFLIVVVTLVLGGSA